MSSNLIKFSWAVLGLWVNVVGYLVFGKPLDKTLDKINLVTNVLDRFMCKYLNINFFGCFRFIFRHWSLMRAQSESVINEVNL